MNLESGDVRPASRRYVSSPIPQIIIQIANFTLERMNSGSRSFSTSSAASSIILAALLFHQSNIQTSNKKIHKKPASHLPRTHAKTVICSPHSST
ncbi:hypothetical protein P5673_016797 [Acropora cervicornis]|uniref:Uncharacterized protein n=1 Tax=Acropora cervicornis TaxID=6130 RepID=A0AAD9V422_ACRCE|nr:hypothetical protein P5673_016797 [Acropora cervicornis]